MRPRCPVCNRLMRLAERGDDQEHALGWFCFRCMAKKGMLPTDPLTLPPYQGDYIA